MIPYVLRCVENGSKGDFSGLMWIRYFMEQNVILKWFSVRKIKEKFQFFFQVLFLGSSNKFDGRTSHFKPFLNA